MVVEGTLWAQTLGMRNLIRIPDFRHIATIGFKVVSAIVLVGFCALPRSNSVAGVGLPAVDFHVISAGGRSLQNSCFKLSGTVAQVAPGFSGNATSSVFAGFWAAAIPTGMDAIFFNGFEGC